MTQLGEAAPAGAASVIAIFGPTASGKSVVASALAERVNGRVVSADAMQVYRGLPILTNQPAELTELVAIWDLDCEASVGEYQRLAHTTVDAILSRGQTPVVAGGTGLYLRAALADLELPPAPPAGLRARIEELYDTGGAAAAHARLAACDPQAASRVHPNDRRRVVRALELAEMGETLHPTTDRLWSESVRHPALLVGLLVSESVLTARIEARTRAMFERGVVDEVQSAGTQILSTTAKRVIGLEEIAELDAAAAAASINRRTRRYAAYQRKWMRRIPGLALVDAERDTGVVADEIREMARAGQRLPPA